MSKINCVCPVCDKKYVESDMSIFAKMNKYESARLENEGFVFCVCPACMGEDAAPVEISRYSYEVSPQGMRMDGAPLYKLVITDHFPILPLFATCRYDELTGEELNFYVSHVERYNAEWSA